MPEVRSIKYGVLAVVAVMAAGLLWLGVVRYQAEQRLHARVAEPEPVTVPVAAQEQPIPVAEPLVVHVAGAVVAPGVYRLSPGARVGDAITAAGGVRPDGAPHVLNLADTLTDGGKIHVMTNEEAAAQGCPPVEARGASQGGAAVAARDTGAANTPAPGKVNVNTASAAQLDQVKWMTPKQAQAIVDYRAVHGPFKRLEDLDNVDGIGPATIDRIRPYVTL
ncbi:MAG TPA: ComEA family DNA-binding protein [Symbiobacteriaceae bacterium]|nr:ComEA family DNA-binding protein [Symbiobacteriaceae bacterium]